MKYASERLASAQLREFRKRRIHRAQTTPAEAIAQLAVIDAHGRRAKLRRAFFTALAPGLLVLGALVASEQRGSDQAPTMAIFVVMAAMSWILRWRQPRWDDRRIAFAQRLLTRLAVPPGATVELTLDLRPIGRRGNEAGRENGRTIYRAQWLALRLPLPDGSLLSLERLEEMRFMRVRQYKREVREWTFFFENTIDLQLPDPQQGYREGAAARFPTATSASLPSLPGVEIRELHADDRRLRLRERSANRWYAGGAIPARSSVDSVEQVLERLKAIYGLAGRSLPTLPPATPPRASLPPLSTKGAMIALGLAGMMGLGLVFASGFEIPKHYGYTQEYREWDPDHSSAWRTLREDVVRTGAFACCCCAFPFTLCIGLGLLGRRRRHAFEAASSVP